MIVVGRVWPDWLRAFDGLIAAAVVFMAPEWGPVASALRGRLRLCPQMPRATGAMIYRERGNLESVTMFDGRKHFYADVTRSLVLEKGAARAIFSLG